MVMDPDPTYYHIGIYCKEETLFDAVRVFYLGRDIGKNLLTKLKTDDG
jgi:hypothetical protein